MVNKSKRIGTGFENRVLSWLEEIWGNYPIVDRSGNATPGRDFSGTPPFAIEAKKWKRWRIASWARYLTGLHGPHNWILFAAPDDLRRSDAPPEVMVVPVSLGRELLKAWKTLNGGLPYD